MARIRQITPLGLANLHQRSIDPFQMVLELEDSEMVAVNDWSKGRLATGMLNAA